MWKRPYGAADVRIPSTAISAWVDTPISPPSRPTASQCRASTVSLCSIVSGSDHTFHSSA